MTVGQLARAGAFLRAARLIRRGFSDGYLVQSLDREWPGQALGTVLEVIRLAHMGVAVVDYAKEHPDDTEKIAEMTPLISTLP